MASREMILEGLRLMADLLATGYDPGTVAGEASARMWRAAGMPVSALNTLFSELNDAAPYWSGGATEEHSRDERLRRVLVAIEKLEAEC